MLCLKDKTILVTGATGFLGTALCKTLDSMGANVIGVDIIKTALAEKLDISNADDVVKFVDSMDRSGIKINGMVNNAAVSFKGKAITNNEFESTLKINVQGTYNCITKFYPILQDKASIVNIASIYGTLSSDYRIYRNNNKKLFSSSAYGASKAAVVQMTKYYAAHYANKDEASDGRCIRVNAVSPGGIWNNHNSEFVDSYSNGDYSWRKDGVEHLMRNGQEI